jgi:hypothetical protein
MKEAIEQFRTHYWSRELQALGHNVRLMPPAYVKPYVKRQKNDMADAEAICEAVTRARATSSARRCVMMRDINAPPTTEYRPGIEAKPRQALVLPVGTPPRPLKTMNLG